MKRDLIIPITDNNSWIKPELADGTFASKLAHEVYERLRQQEADDMSSVKAKLGRKIKAQGNCFQHCMIFIAQHPRMNGLMLAHGIAVGTGGQAKGLSYEHAWLEHEGFCIDVTTEALLRDPVIIEKELYYKVGSISNVKLYSSREAKENAIKHRIYGPWK